MPHQPVQRSLSQDGAAAPISLKGSEKMTVLLHCTARIAGAVAGAALLASAFGSSVMAQGSLRIGMTANDVPLTWGQPDNGFEGYRFMGLLVYDALINGDV